MSDVNSNRQNTPFMPGKNHIDDISVYVQKSNIYNIVTASGLSNHSWDISFPLYGKYQVV